MKTRRYAHLFFILLFIAGCKKDEPVTRSVEFKSTTYKTLGTYDYLGKPDYIIGRDTISSALQTFINDTLPDGVDLRNSNPELLTTKAIADIEITEPSNAYITFVSTGGRYTNAFAFYTYPTSQPPASTEDIKVITYVFPNAGYLTPLTSGDKVKLGRFQPGTSIGFVLLQNAWDTTAHTLNNKVVHFCSNDVLNPEVDPALRKHAVLIDYLAEDKVLIGFEDRNRTDRLCDHDFNDLVLYCTVTP